MKLAIVGGGGHGKVVLDLTMAAGEHSIVGVIDSAKPRGTSLLGYEVLGDENELARLVEQGDVDALAVALGDNTLRARLAVALSARHPGLYFPNLIHPRAVIGAGVRLGRGNVFAAGAIVNADSCLGNFCIVNTGASLDHEGSMGNFASLAPGACCGGNVAIGEYSAIGLGARVIHRVTIGAETVVGAGATVLRDLPERVVAYGTPARIIRSREPGERYL